MSNSTHIVCPSCARTNRVSEDKQLDQAKCGVCGHALFDAKPADVSADAMKKHIAKSDVPVLIDVWAPWCGPCRMMAPAYEEAARTLEPDVRLLKLNSDNEQAYSNALGIRGIPTMLLMHHGREIARTSGAMPASAIVGWVRQQLQSAAA